MLRIFENRIANNVITPLIAGVILGILAPFGSSNFEPIFRFIYWIGLTFAGGIGAVAAGWAQDRFLPATSVTWQALSRSIGATVAVSSFVFSLNSSLSLASILLTLFYIWVVAIVITTFGMLSARPQTPPKSDEKPALLLDRLPPKFRTLPLYAISSEDHYVRIHSEAGEHMLLMRLADAEDLAAPIQGLKPHRSWWVAESGVEETLKENGKLRIRLKSGVYVPVSREGAKRIRAANWI